MSKRFERQKRSGVRLTERDFESVEALFEARYLTNQMVCRLFYKPTTFSWCRQRLRYLYDLGYVKKRQVHVNERDIYYLGLKGRRYIAANYPEYSRVEVDKIAGVSGRNVEAPTLMMNHEMTMARLYVNARLETRHYGLSLRWKNTRMLELMRLGMEPDGFVAVGHGDKERAAFLEFSGELPKRADMAQKVQAYEQYLESMRWRQDFGVESLGILWLTTSRSKAQRIWEGVARSSHKDYFLVGLIEDAGQFLTRSMWRWSESEQKVSFVPAPEESVYVSTTS